MYTNLNIPQEKLLEQMNTFSTVAGHKINIWKSLIFLFTNSEYSEEKIKKIIPLKITSKRTKYLEINLITKDWQTAKYFWKKTDTK